MTNLLFITLVTIIDSFCIQVSDIHFFVLSMSFVSVSIPLARNYLLNFYNKGYSYSNRESVTEFLIFQETLFGVVQITL